MNRIFLSPASLERASGFLRSRMAGTLLLVAVSLLVLLPGNASTSLWDRDEPRYVAVAHDMLKTGDYIVPYFNGELRFQKPVLSYWLIAGSFALFGESEFAARLVSVLSVLGAVLATQRLGNRMFGTPAGLIAGLMLLLTPVPLFVGKLAIPDGPLLLFSTLSFLCLYEMWLGENSPSVRAAWGFFFWINIGLSLLTKGPVVPAMLLLTGLTYWWLSRVSWRELGLRWRVGLLIVMAVAGPWFAAIYWAAGSGFFQVSVGQQVLGRAMISFDGRWLPTGYYFATLVVGFAPWLPLALVAIWHFRNEWRRRGPIAFLVAWTFGPMVLLEFFRSKQIHYFAPSYPALSLLAAGYLLSVFRFEAAARGPQDSAAVPFLPTGKWKLAFINTQSAMLLVVGGALLVLAIVGPPDGMLAAGLLGSFVLAAAVYAYRQYRVERLTQGWLVQTVAMGITAMAVSAVYMPSLNGSRVMHDIGVALKGQTQNQMPVIPHRVLEPSIVYYCESPIPQIVDVEPFTMKVASCDHDFVTLLSESEYQSLAEKFGKRLSIEQTWNGWVKMHADVVHLVRVRAREAEGQAVPVLGATQEPAVH